MCVAAAVATGCVWHAFLVTEISDFRRIDGGRCADIFEFDVGRVLKLYDHRFSAEWVGQAAERAQLIVDAGVRVPGIFGIESVGGRFGVVMERIDGETLWERVAQRPGDAAALGADLARLHVEINSIEVGESFVDALGLMPQSHLHDPTISPVRHEEWTRTKTGSSSFHSPLTRARWSWLLLVSLNA